MKPRSTKCSASTKVAGRIRSRLHAANIGKWIVRGLFTVLVASGAHAQEKSPQPVLAASQVKRPPVSHFYMYFLLYQNHLDKEAAIRETEGKDGSWLRDHFQQQLGFTGSQFSIIRATALRLESGLNELGSEAKIIAEKERAARLANPNAPRVPNPQLQDLTKQQEDLIQREMDSLIRDLGPKDSAKLQAYLENHFVQNGTPPIALSHLPPESKPAQPDPKAERQP